MRRSDKFEVWGFYQENMPVQLLLAQVGHMYKWYVTNQTKDTELKAGQAGILAILQMVGPMSQRELADHIHITPPSVNVAVQKLEKLGYIRKENGTKRPADDKDPSDRTWREDSWQQRMRFSEARKRYLL